MVAGAPHTDVPAALQEAARREEADHARGPSSAAARLTTPALLLGIWLTGFSGAVGALIVSLLRVRRVARTAQHVTDQAWQISADRLRARLGLRYPVQLLLSRAVSTPMAGGVFRPVIFLPIAALAWDEEQRDVVLAHEIAHLARWDPLRHVIARLAVAWYWFLPLSWMAARQATAAREQACDETVLALGTRPSVYARVLVELSIVPGDQSHDDSQ
jgi:beta-lactamase regulating signal transducer with metallopeptidase domain